MQWVFLGSVGGTLCDTGVSFVLAMSMLHDGLNVHYIGHGQNHK